MSDRPSTVGSFILVPVPGGMRTIYVRWASEDVRKTHSFDANGPLCGATSKGAPRAIDPSCKRCQLVMRATNKRARPTKRQWREISEILDRWRVRHRKANVK